MNKEIGYVAGKRKVIAGKENQEEKGHYLKMALTLDKRMRRLVY